MGCLALRNGPITADALRAAANQLVLDINASLDFTGSPLPLFAVPEPANDILTLLNRIVVEVNANVTVSSPVSLRRGQTTDYTSAFNQLVLDINDVASCGGAVLPDFLIDFKNGNYTVGSTSYTLADVITHTDLVTPGTGLVIPDRTMSPGIQEILGPFNDRLIHRQCTLILSLTGMGASLNGSSVILNVQNDDLSSGYQGASRNSGGELNFAAEDFGAAADNFLITSGMHYDVGSHKFGILLNGATEPLALAADGVLIDWIFTPALFPTETLTKSCFGGDYLNGSDACRNTVTVESLQCLAPVALGDLAALTA